MKRKHADWGRRLKEVFQLLVKTFERFSEVEAPRLAASLAFYSLFSLFPLVLLTVTVFGFSLGQGEAARKSVMGFVEAGLTPEARTVLNDTLARFQEQRSAQGAAAVAGVLSLGWGASGVFVELYTAISRIFRVPPPPPSKNTWGTIRVLIKERAAAFTLMGGLALLSLASLITSTALDIVEDRFLAYFPSARVFWLLEAATSFVLITFSIVALFHVITRKLVPFRYNVAGAAVTTFAFTVLKTLFAQFSSRFTNYAVYGVLGVVLALAVWIYINGLVLFFGAQLAEVLAKRAAARSETDASPSPQSSSPQSSSPQSSSPQSSQLLPGAPPGRSPSLRA